MKRLSILGLAALLAAGALVGCGSKGPQDLLFEADQLADAGDFAGALAIAKKVKQMPLDDVNYGLTCMVLGKYYVYSNDYAAARKEFQEVYDRWGVENPKAILANQARDAALNLIYSWLYQDNQTQKALEQLQETSSTLTRASAPFSRHLSQIAAQILFDLKRYDDAYKEVQALLKTEPDPNAVLQLLDQEAGIRVAQQRWNDAAQIYFDYAAAHRDNRYLKAEMTLRAGLSYPENPPDDALKAKRKRLLSDAAAAFAALRRTETDPDVQSQMYLREATADWAMGEKILAEDCLTSVTQRLAVNPDIRGEALLGLAEFKASNEQYDQARELYRQLQREFPRFQEQAVQGIAMVNRKIAEKAVLGPGGGTGPSASQPSESQPSSTPAAITPGSGGESASAPSVEKGEAKASSPPPSLTPVSPPPSTR